MNLSALRSVQGAICLVECDNSTNLAKNLGLDITLEANLVTLDLVNKNLIATASPACSGIVLDPIYTLKHVLSKHNRTALLLRIEQLIENVDPLAVPSLIPGWGVENIKNNYGLVKLELYYHPQEEKALLKKQLLAEIYDYCQYIKVGFFLKLIIYTPANEQFDQIKFQEAQIEAVTELQTMVDVMALQFPYDALSCATMTAEVDIPWVVQLEGNNYEIMKQNLRTALENGARGFSIGYDFMTGYENLKKDDMSLDLTAFNNFMQTIARDRLLELRRISDELIEKD